MGAKIEQVYDEGCEHCRHNPKAKPPYAKMKHIRYDKETIRLFKKHGEGKGMNINCFVCKGLRSLMEEMQIKLSA